MENKETTIEDLAGMIKNGFDGVDERFDEIEQKLDKHAVMLISHDELLKDHTERLQRIESKLENVVHYREFDELKGRVDTLERQILFQIWQKGCEWIVRLGQIIFRSLPQEENFLKLYQDRRIENKEVAPYLFHL